MQTGKGLAIPKVNICDLDQLTKQIYPIRMRRMSGSREAVLLHQINNPTHYPIPRPYSPDSTELSKVTNFQDIQAALGVEDPTIHVPTEISKRLGFASLQWVAVSSDARPSLFLGYDPKLHVTPEMLSLNDVIGTIMVNPGDSLRIAGLTEFPVGVPRVLAVRYLLPRDGSRSKPVNDITISVRDHDLPGGAYLDFLYTQTQPLNWSPSLYHHAGFITSGMTEAVRRDTVSIEALRIRDSRELGEYFNIEYLQSVNDPSLFMQFRKTRERIILNHQRVSHQDQPWQVVIPRYLGTSPRR